jgi:fructokinase
VRLGGIEAGGTTFVCVVGDEHGRVDAEVRFPTRDPASTLADVVAFFRDAAATHHLDAFGIAAFGPLELRPTSPRYGYVTASPKPGWRDVDLIGPMREFDLPVAIDTDVNGAALAEARWGAATGLDGFVYVTVGTGIGGGAIIEGRAVHGLVHPEMGHMSVARAPGDVFSGHCPFHGDCFEGMASGSAIAARWGRPAETLSGADLTRAVEIEAWYLAAGLRNIVYAVAPERIVIGGGVIDMPGLFPLVRERLIDALGGYPGLPELTADDFVQPAALGRLAGAKGALLLAHQALRPEGGP